MSVSIAHTALACRRAQAIYLRDVADSGRIAVDWHALDYQVRQSYVERAADELARESHILTFPARFVSASELVPHAVRDIEAAIADLVNAANDAQSGQEAVEMQSLISELTVKLNAVSAVAWHREQSFFPKGA